MPDQKSLMNAAAAVVLILSSAVAGQIHAAAAPAACVVAAPLELGRSPVPVIKVYTGADGVSHIDRQEITGFAIPFFHSGGVLTQTVLGPSLKVVIVRGPPNADIPIRTGIGRVMFLTVQGSTTVILPDGAQATASPGDLIIFDDASSKTGHGGRTGPCGYTALSLAIPDGAPDIAIQR